MGEEQRMERVENTVSQHSERIAKLEQIACSIDMSMKDLGIKFDKQFEAYMMMQGSLKAVLDIKEEINKIVDGQDKRLNNHADRLRKVEFKVYAFNVAILLLVGIVEFVGNLSRIVDTFK